jgi:hypothetical protein
MSAPRSPWIPDEPDTPNVVPDPPPVEYPTPPIASADQLIDRPELGPEAATFIAAGDPIPAHLVNRPSRPVKPVTKPARSTMVRATGNRLRAGRQRHPGHHGNLASTSGNEGSRASPIQGLCVPTRTSSSGAIYSVTSAGRDVLV